MSYRPAVVYCIYSVRNCSIMVMRVCEHLESLQRRAESEYNAVLLGHVLWLWGWRGCVLPLPVKALVERVAARGGCGGLAFREAFREGRVVVAEIGGQAVVREGLGDCLQV